MADGTAIDRLRDSAPDPASAAALAITAGVDLSLWDEAFTHVEEAVERGILDPALVTRAADRVLALKQRVGLLDEVRPEHAVADPTGSRTTRGFLELAHRAAAQSCVLVHDDGVLPLPASAVVAVIGPNADDLEAQLGDYTPPRPDDDPHSSTVRSALQARHGIGGIRYAQGTSHRSRLPGDAAEQMDAALSGADAAVVVLGGTSRRSYDDEFADNGAVDGPAPDTTNGEGVDLSRLELPEAQLDLLRVARAAVPVVIAVLIDGRPRPLEPLLALADALIVAPFPGPVGGAAIVDVLATGVGGGLLPATFPASDGVLPVAHDERRETARGYVDARHPVGRLLGSGAPDVSVRLRPVQATLTAADLREGGTVTLTADLVNDTDRTVSLAVPLYGRRHELGVRPRRRSLLAVARVRIAAGSTSVVGFTLGLDELGSWAGGRPVPAPVEVVAWTDPSHDPPSDALVVRITDEEGDTGWGH